MESMDGRLNLTTRPETNRQEKDKRRQTRALNCLMGKSQEAEYTRTTGAFQPNNYAPIQNAHEAN